MISAGYTAMRMLTNAVETPAEEEAFKAELKTELEWKLGEWAHVQAEVQTYAKLLADERARLHSHVEELDQLKASDDCFRAMVLLQPRADWEASQAICTDYFLSTLLPEDSPARGLAAHRTPR